MVKQMRIIEKAAEFIKAFTWDNSAKLAMNFLEELK